MTNNQNQKYALIFDVETTGLIPKFLPRKDGVSPIQLYPYILQLSFIIYDMNESKIIETYNEYIRPPSHVFINPNITSLTGISRQLCDDSGVSIIDAIHAFYSAYARCQIIVAHNLSFDQTMMEVEIHRNLEQLNPYVMCMFNSLYNRFNNKELYCTMKAGKKICNLVMPVLKEGQRPYMKFPKLIELYEKLFKEIPENLHDAFVDCRACLRCFLELYRKSIPCEEPPLIVEEPVTVDRTKETEINSSSFPIYY